ncbi:MAG: universal stress protein [Chloroflexi bacterium]|nr:universal stress protein [Chloroflexota bacterium]
MYLKILVPLDGSEVAECVLPHVEVLSRGYENASITFIYVVPPLDAPMVNPNYRSKLKAEARNAAEDYLKKLCAKARFKDRASGKVIVGKVADAIVEYAAKNRMDIIVMATHGRSGVSHWFYGSVAEKVVHGSKIPIWLVKASSCHSVSYAHNKKLSVLVTLDGSEVAESVLPHLMELSRQLPKNKMDIVLMRVCEIFAPPISYPPPVAMSWEEYLAYETKRCKEICQDYLNQIQGKLEKSGLKTRTEVPQGNPAEVLIKYINKNPVDLVIIVHSRPHRH